MPASGEPNGHAGVRAPEVPIAANLHGYGDLVRVGHGFDVGQMDNSPMGFLRGLGSGVPTEGGISVTQRGGFKVQARVVDYVYSTI